MNSDQWPQNTDVLKSIKAFLKPYYNRYDVDVSTTTAIHQALRRLVDLFWQIAAWFQNPFRATTLLLGRPLSDRLRRVIDSTAR